MGDVVVPRYPIFKYILIPLFWGPTELTRYTRTDVGTAWDTIEFQYVPIDFDELPVERIGIIAKVHGNEVGTKGIRLYNATDGVPIASATWSGTEWLYVSAFSDIVLTGLKLFLVQWYGSSGTEDLDLDSCMLVLVIKATAT